MRGSSIACALCSLGGGAAAVLDAPSEHSDPFWEPTEAEFWGGDGEEAPMQPVRLTNTTTEEFEAYIRRGMPVIVTDAARGWSEGGMGDWTCEGVRKLFKGQHQEGDAPIFLQYANADGQGGIKPVEMGSKSWQDHKHDNGESAGGADSTATGAAAAAAQPGPKLAPIYWGVKDGERGPGSMFEKVRRYTRLPYFLRRTSANSDFVPSTPEFWFSRPGAGAKAHQDSHCQGTMSVQLSGVKRWRIGPTPPVPNLATARPLFDSYVDTAKWAPLFEFELRKGEGLFFPTSFVHETANVGDICAASITFQYDFPQPTAFLRHYLPRLYAAPNMQECRLQGMYERAILLGKQGAMRPSKAHTPAAAAALRKQAAGVVAQMDSDGDGALSLSELVEGLRTGGGDEAGEVARDAIGFHDVDGDGILSAGEIGTSWVRWNAVAGTMRAARDAMRRYRRLRQRAGCDDAKTKAAERAVAELFGADSGRGQAPAPDAVAAATQVAGVAARCRAVVGKEYVALLGAAQVALPNLELSKVSPTKSTKPTGTDEDEFDEFVDEFDRADGGGIGPDLGGGGDDEGGHGEEDEEGGGEGGEEEERRDSDEDDRDEL